MGSTASGSGLLAQSPSEAARRDRSPALFEHERAMTAIALRDYRHPQDYPAVVALWERCGPGVQLSRSDQPEELSRKVEHDPDLFVLAVLGDQVVGTVVGGYDGRRGLVYHLAVDAAHRRRGLGRRLMEEIEDRLRKRGCLKCYLLVAAEAGEAVEFYRGHGWQTMDVTLMGKELQ